MCIIVGKVKQSMKLHQNYLAFFKGKDIDTIKDKTTVKKRKKGKKGKKKKRYEPLPFSPTLEQSQQIIVTTPALLLLLLQLCTGR